MADDAAACAQQPNERDQRPEVEITIVGSMLEALYLAVPRPPSHGACAEVATAAVR